MADDVLPKEALVDLRKELGFTQQEMANQLGMALRSYQGIEAGTSEYRQVHKLAAERVALAVAAHKKDPMLAAQSVRRDAIELVRVGRLTRHPAFQFSEDAALEPEEAERDLKFLSSYSAVGELVLITTALDQQLNHVLIQVLHLGESPMLEAVIATLDMPRKIEMLKERVKHIAPLTWSKPIRSYIEKLESVARTRNIACHTPLIPDRSLGPVFAPTAAAKLLKNLKPDEPTANRMPISKVKTSISLAESALADGQILIQNFKRVNLERTKRYGK